MIIQFIRETDIEKIRILNQTSFFLLLSATVTVGLGAAWISWLKDTAIGSMLFMNYGVSHVTTGIILQVIAIVLMLAVMGLFFRPTRLLCSGILSGYLAILIFAVIDQGGHPFSEYTFAAYAMRLAAPLAFMVVCSRALQHRYPAASRRIALWLLILATSVTFFMHGLEALWAHPWFVDMTITMADNLTGWPMSESVAERLLVAVGLLDILSAALLLFQSRIAASWMVIWGFFTCILRVVNYGAGGLPDAMIRLPHGLIPLILLVEFTRQNEGRYESEASVFTDVVSDSDSNSCRVSQ